MHADAMNPASFHAQGDLFGAPDLPLPEGMRYEPDFLDADEEAGLIALIGTLPLKEMQYKSYTARRRIASFGGRYDFDKNALQPAGDMPASMEPLRAKVATWLGVEPEQFTQVLIAEYRPGTPLGWHRDVSDFDDIVGVSLGSTAMLRFRPYPPVRPKKADIVKIPIEPRSIYLLRGPARWAWQHSVAPTVALRHSITFRTPARR
jgi:alkylated DNA repair dioxygenase AlkB